MRNCGLPYLGYSLYSATCPPEMLSIGGKYLTPRWRIPARERFRGQPPGANGGPSGPMPHLAAIEMASPRLRAPIRR